MDLIFNFKTEFTDLKERNNQLCKVVRQFRYPEVDEEILLFEVRFEDGSLGSAWPDELELLGHGTFLSVHEWLTFMEAGLEEYKNQYNIS